MNHRLQCRCGEIQGQVSLPAHAGRGLCYCKDCQSFAHFLGKPDAVLDDNGGTDVIAVAGRRISFTQGLPSLACMSLSPKGLLRWYSHCCKTAIAATPRNYKLSHVSLIHTCLQDPAKTLNASFGPVRMVVNTQGAKHKPPSNQLSTTATIGRFLGAVAVARLNGSYRQTPFFDAASGNPVITPTVLGLDERQRLLAAVAAWRDA